MKRPTNDIIEKVLMGQAMAEDIKRVTEWFATDEGQTALASHMDHNYPLLQSKQAISQAPSEQMWKQICRKIRFASPWNRWKNPVLWTAAILIPALFLVSRFIHDINQQVELFGTSPISEVYVPKGEHTRIIFQDGSSVYLGPDSYLYYPQRFNRKERSIRFTGEAYFDIAKNPKWPFIIQLGEVSLKVLGTSFNVMASPEKSQITVSLDEGEVRMNTLSNNKSFCVTPGESVTYNKITRELSTAKSRSKGDYYSNWKDDFIEFNSTPLPDVLETLSRKHNVHFLITDTVLCRLTYTMHVENNNLEKVLNDLENITPIHFHLKGDSIHVYRK